MDMATAAQVMKAFMTSLDNTSLSGTAALDEAVQACSSFTSIQAVISQCIIDCQNADSADAFLTDYCGIVLDNTDTGAISGSDAGGTTTKTAQSIVPESGSATAPAGSSSTYGGLTVTWPTGTLTSVEQTIVSYMNTWWIPNSIQLIGDSYGFTFEETGSRMSDMKIAFKNAADGTLATTGYSWDSSTQKYTLTLTINMYYYAGMDTSDLNGSTTTAGAGYLDRTLAHEITHALMMANIDTFSSLPQFITEGSAELIHGIDDQRTYLIESLAGTASSLRSALNLLDTSTGNSSAYAGGYIFLRYLAKQASNPTEALTAGPLTGSYYSVGKTKLLLTSSFTAGKIRLDGSDGVTYAGTLVNVDGSALSSGLTLVGNTADNTLIAGSGGSQLWGGTGGSDTLQGGSGVDTFWFDNGDGSDTITNFTAGQDILYFYNGQLTDVTTSGNNVVIQAGSSTVTVTDAVGSQLTVKKGDKTYQCVFARQDQANTVAWASNLDFYFAAGSYTHTLQLTGSSDTSIRLDNTGSQTYMGFTRIDASTSTGSNTLVGSSASDTILAGSGGSQLWGGIGGNDTLQGGSGADTFWYDTGDGSDTISGFTSGQDTIYLYNGILQDAATSGTNIVLKVSASEAVTVTDGVGRQLTIKEGGRIYESIFARQDQASTVAWASNLDFYFAAGSYTHTLQLTGSSDTSIRLDNTGSQTYMGFTRIDASGSTGSNTLVGSSASDTILAGTGGSQLWGGTGGSDTLQGGSGADVVWYGTGDGSDTFLSGGSTDSVYLYNINTIDAVQFSLQDTTLQLGLATGEKLSIDSWSADTGINTFRLSDQSKYSLSLSNGTLTASRL